MSDQRQRTALPDVDLSSSASFEDFVEAEAPRLFAALRLVTGDRSEAESVMLEALMQVWDRWDRVRASGDAFGDLFRTAMGTYHKRASSDEPVRRKRPFASPDPFAAREASDGMLVALDALKPEERLSLVLMDLFGYPSKDVGELMGIRASRVRTSASHGRAELRKRLDGSGADIRTCLRQAHDDIVPPPDIMGTLVGRRKRLDRRKRDRRRKIGSVVIGIVVAAAGVAVVAREMARPPSEAAPDSDPIPVILPGGRLAPGPHVMSLAGLQITFNVPDGWRGSEAGVVDADFGPDGPNGAALTFWTVSNVYKDPCNWKGSAMQPPVGSSVNELVAALATQKDHPSGPRIKLDVAGYPATQLEMKVGKGLDLAKCDNGEFHSWQSPAGDRYHQSAGQVDRLFVVNVLGMRVLIDVSYFPGTSESDRSAVLAMFRSVRLI